MRINLQKTTTPSAGSNLGQALEFDDMADPAQVYSAGNRFPPEETEDGSAAAAFPRTDSVTLVPKSQVVSRVLPFVGQPTRTTEEQTILTEVEQALATEQ